MGLTALQKIKDHVKRRPEELSAEREKGKKVVGWLGYNIPEELIHALGLIPVRLGTGGDDRVVEHGSRYISTKNCVFTRASVGIFAENKDPYVLNSDFVAIDSTCTHMYRVAELIKYYFKVTTAILGVPKNFFLPESHEYFYRELEAFTNKLEEFAGSKLELKKLKASIKLFDRIRTAINALYRYQSALNHLISWRELYDVIHAGYYLDRVVYADLLNELLAELKDKQGEPVIKQVAGEARILLSGSTIPPGDTKLIDIVEQVGGRIVGDDLWSGLSPFVGLNIKEPSIRGVADAYINRLPHGALPYLDQKTDRRLENLRRIARDFKAQGVIYHTLRYCDPFSFKAGETKDVLKNFSVPLLEIHTEYAGSDYEAIRTRVEAFVEMIKFQNISVEVAA